MSSIGGKKIFSVGKITIYMSRMAFSNFDRYRATVENALTLADFQQSTNMTVLQAFTIYIV